jgi:hypothetical protein
VRLQVGIEDRDQLDGGLAEGQPGEAVGLR